MGGRGGSSSFSGRKTTGMDVTHNGETTRYYFSKHGETNFYQRGIDGNAEPTPLNMTATEFKQRVESNGATVKPVTAAAMKTERKNYEAYRKAADAFLDQQTASNRELSRGSKMAAKGNRATRRSRGR